MTYNDSLGTLFVMPETQRWRFRDYVDFVKAKRNPQTTKERNERASKRKGVYYISHQNSSLTDEDEFGSRLMADLDGGELSFAKAAFDSKPDAINLWMGAADAVTSLHKDHYENTYCVIKGRKHFTLYPPSSVNHLRTENLPAAQYREREDGTFAVEQSPAPARPWILVDPEDESTWDQNYHHCHRIDVTVEAGDMLYLPSLWYHQVISCHAMLGRAFANV